MKPILILFITLNWIFSAFQQHWYISLLISFPTLPWAIAGIMYSNFPEE